MLIIAVLALIAVTSPFIINSNVHASVKVSDSFAEVQDTIGIIYDDIDRRPARLRDRREIAPGDRTTRRVADPAAAPEITREELQERLRAPTDSTARLRHFKYRRRDAPVAQYSSGSRRHPFFLANRNQAYKKSVEMDSLGTRVTIRETVDGTDVKIPVTLSMDEYIRQRARAVRRAGWERRAYEYDSEELVDRRSDLSDFISDITTIDIPVPPNPLLNIFGKPGLRLNISGAVDIRAAMRRQTYDQTTLSNFNATRNEPDFRQDVQINVDGLVGDKLHINADWNTQRTFEYENQLMIRYQGYDDEIVQVVEAGNVSLQTPTRFIGSSQALFGIKSQLQFGPMRLTALASQQKGRSEEISISGGTQEQSFDIRPYDYSRNHYFVHEEYIQWYEDVMSLEPRYDAGLEITDIELWVTRSGQMTDVNERPVAAHIDLPTIAAAGGQYGSAWHDVSSAEGRVEVGQFVMLRQGEDYTLNQITGHISLRTNIANEQAIAVAFRQANGAVYGDFVGGIDDDSTRIVLRLVRPRNLQPQFRDAWLLQLRNIYSLGGRNIQRDGFELSVEYEVPGQQARDELEGQRLLHVLGLDIDDEAGSGNPDNRFDWRAGVTINPARGEVIFPSLRPFDNKLAEAGLGEYGYPEIYDTTSRAAANLTEKDRFRIRGRHVSTASSSYDLGFNVVEGSVGVYLGNRRLEEGIDYTVDYMLGQITIRNDEALQPNANLRITYEQNELFQMASKTLLGLRGELPIGRYSDINFTMMTMREETLADRVRVGEEPISNLIFGMDGRTRIPMNFVTDAMNKLPIFESIEESSLQLSGEFAYIRPDRNTKRSRVDMDHGQGVAYIDDFEGSRRSVPIGVNYGMWKYASPPVETPEIGRLPAATMSEYKANAYWFNPQDDITVVRDIWPDRLVAKSDERVTVLHIRFEPRDRGVYNYSWNLMETIYHTPHNSWGGMMRALSGATHNLVDENLNFIEFWAKIEGDPGDGKMYINMGQISERIIYEERLRGNRVHGIHQEDGLLTGIPTGTLNTAEDVGIDGLSTEQEREVFADWIAHYAGTVFHEQLLEDPSGDNYRPPRPGDFSGAIGYEGNSTTTAGYLPDTEDLNRDGFVNDINSYFEYEISLDMIDAIERNPHVIGGGNEGWYQFRIPVRSYDKTIGTPSLNNVEFIRVWFSGFEEPMHLRIAEFAFTGNQWEEEERGDTTLVASVLNKHENPTVYNSPPGVNPPRDRLPDGTTVEGNEQSLVLMVNDLQPGDNRQVFRYFPRRSLDVFNYGTMRLFVYGDPSWHADNQGQDFDAEIFIRFGADTSNYYEYRQPIRPDWHNIEINFADLTAIKSIRDTSTNISPPVPVSGGPPGATYRVVRNPSLTELRYISIGIRNPRQISEGGRPLNGQVWVNEMRLLDVDNTPGWAYRVGTVMNFADLGTVRFNFSQVDPNFHRLDQHFGTRQTSRNWDMSANFRLQKFLPADWQRGTELPINYSRSEMIVNPQYIPRTDVLISGAMERQREQLEEAGVPPDEARRMVEEIRLESQTVRITDTYSAPVVRVRAPSDRWYVRETLNNLQFGFNYNTTRDRNPTVTFRNSWSWQGRADYALAFGRNNYFQPFRNIFDGLPILDHYKETRFFYTPVNFNTGMNLQRGRTDERLRGQDRNRDPVRNFRANRNMAFNWRLVENAFINPAFDYRLNIASSLVHLETDHLGRQRPFSDLVGDIVGGPGLLDFGLDNNYTQDIRLDTRPRLPSFWSINRYFELNTGYSAGYRWTRNLSQETLGRSSAVSTRFDASMTINLKSLGDNIFGTTAQQTGGRTQPAAPRGRGQDRDQEPEDGNDGEESHNQLESLKTFLTYLIKVPFLDYDRINISFNQSQNIQNNGLVGGTGLHNFWGKVPFSNDPDVEHGPSRRYQLGLSSVPALLRAPNANLIDNFSETNRVTLRTQRQLWRGARIDLTWSYSWSFNRNNSLISDEFGVPHLTNTNLSGDIEKSFLTLPQMPGLKIFGGNLDDVIEIFQESLADPADERSEGEKLSDAFEKGMESFSLLSGLLGDALPRVNWTFRWEGLERLGIFNGWASRVSLDHAYQSLYSQRWRGRQEGSGKQTETQRVTMRFNPLLGVNVTFQELMQGNVTTSARLNTQTNYDLNYSSRIIVQTLTHELSFTASYRRSGFEMPLFGVSLRNDIDISMTYSMARNERIRYTTEILRTGGEGLTDDGATRTSFEPRIRYVISQRVTASIFYRFSKVAPNREGSRTPGYTTNEAGLDINISIR
jgi:hypothetical protein